MWNDYPEVKLIADSIYNDNRISTFQVKYWRPLLAESNTHRIFSRNAASSRAQSWEKRCEEATENTCVPKHWNAEQKGMVGGEEFSPATKEFLNAQIQHLAQSTVDYLNQLNAVVRRVTDKEIHKQYLNRYLEPFVSTTQLITSTDWDNWFKLRMAEDAQPEMQDLATEMFYALQDSQPKESNLHLPYVTFKEFKKYGEETSKKISVARCARVSYRSYDENIVLEKDLELYDRLWDSGHLSPFEHVAYGCEGHYYNLDGWKSLRYVLEHSINPGSTGSK